ncbi:hypothetical protein H0H93_002930 [Arthromyces matolae]|nr:hypothetical protein H0H93_002930 [Arthromyces matolae]
MDTANTSALVSYLRGVLGNTVEYKQLVSCQPPYTQKVLDSFQWLLDVPTLDWDFRNKLIVATQKISATSGLYPACYDLKEVEQIGYQVDGGVFGDIFKGDFDGLPVCLKAVRIFGQDERKKILKVRGSLEAILWGQLYHPNVLPFFGLFHSISLQRPCLVSPWMRHGNIINYLREHPVEAPRRLLALDVSKGLQYLHGLGIVHGDLKGPNILIDDYHRACLADFGISSVTDLNFETPQWTAQSSVASKGGSIRWQAPELLDPRRDDIAHNTVQSDIYALACVLYEVSRLFSSFLPLFTSEKIFTGNLPLFEIKNVQQIPKKVWDGTRPTCPDRLSPSWNQGLAKNIWSLMKKCWEKRVDLRPPLVKIVQKLQSTAPRDTRLHNTGSSDELLPSAFRRKMSEGIDVIDVQTLKVIVGPNTLNSETIHQGSNLTVIPPSMQLPTMPTPNDKIDEAVIAPDNHSNTDVIELPVNQSASVDREINTQAERHPNQ